MIFRTCSKLYRYVFYKLYRWSEAVNSKHERHEINAVMMLSLVVIANLGTIPAVIQLITGYEAFRILAIPKYYGAVIAIFMMIANFTLLKKYGFKKIIQEFSHERVPQQKFGNVLVTCYVLGSFLLLFASFALVAIRDY